MKFLINYILSHLQIIMDIFIEQCIDIINMIVNKENIKEDQNHHQQQLKPKVIFHIGPDKKNAYQFINFDRWEF